MKNTKTYELIMTGVFAALTFCGTMVKIPLPTGDFVHLGNSVVLLGVLLIGYKQGALAGGLGFAIFDILNGYAAEAPYFILESFVVGGGAYLAYSAFKKNPSKIWQISMIAASAGIAKLAMTQLKNTLIGITIGADISTAFMAGLIKIPATAINVCSTIIIVSLLYFPLKKALATVHLPIKTA